MALFDLNGDDLREFRLAQQFSADQMARLLGYMGNTAHDQVMRIERGERPLMPPQCLLLAAYMDGWRPEIWPKPSIDEAAIAATQPPASPHDLADEIDTAG